MHNLYKEKVEFGQIELQYLNKEQKSADNLYGSNTIYRSDQARSH